MIKRILVGLGGADYTASAINQAVALAMAHDAEVTGVSVNDPEHVTPTLSMAIGEGALIYPFPEADLKKAKERIELATQELIDACRGAGIRYRVLREVGEPFSVMTSEARYHDLMVFGLRSLFDSDFVPDPHNVLVRLVQAGVRPLIAVSKTLRPVTKVLIAYSGSMESATAMKRFVQMRLLPVSQLRIISFDDGGGANAQQLVTDAADYCRAHGLNAETECINGSPKEQLLPYAESWGADLMVMGNSAKNLLLRRLFGDTAFDVIRNANLPLFLAQ